MKSTFFWSITELRRRWKAFAAFFILQWTAVYSTTGFIGVLDGFGSHNRDSLLGLLTVCSLTAVLLLGIGAYLVQSDRYRRFGKEYRVLRQCGMGFVCFCLVQVWQVLVMFGICLVTALPLAGGTVVFLTFLYNRRMAPYLWLADIPEVVRLSSVTPMKPVIPWRYMLISAVVCLVLFLLVTLLSCIAGQRGQFAEDVSRLRNRRGEAVCDDILLRNSCLHGYDKVTRKRLGRVYSRSRWSMTLCLILPIFLLFMGAEGIPKEQPGFFDHNISAANVRYAIPQSAVDVVDSWEGITFVRGLDCTDVYERITQQTVVEPLYTTAYFDIEPDMLSTIVPRLHRYAQENGWTLYCQVLNLKLAGMDGLAFDFLCLLALLTGLCGVCITFAVAGDYYRYRESERVLFSRMGMDDRYLRKKAFQEGVHFLLTGYMAALVLCSLLWFPVAADMGESFLFAAFGGVGLTAVVSVGICTGMAYLFTYGTNRKEKQK